MDIIKDNTSDNSQENEENSDFSIKMKSPEEQININAKDKDETIEELKSKLK